MPDRDVKIKERLVNEREDYRKLDELHQGFDERLTELNDKAFLSDEEQIEITKIKKEKLHLKDKMASIARDFVGGNSAASGQ
jgi:uncharacterized protein YdcH (DUF465 family)